MIFTLVCAVPSNFDLTYHLSLREMANIASPDDEHNYFGDAVNYDHKYKMNVELLQALAGTIARSKVSVLTNRRPEMFKKLCDIFKDLGLVIHRRWDPNMAATTTRMENEQQFGRDSRLYMLMAVNVLAINEDEEQWKKVLENIIKLEDYYPPEEVMKKYA